MPQLDFFFSPSQPIQIEQQRHLLPHGLKEFWFFFLLTRTVVHSSCPPAFSWNIRSSTYLLLSPLLTSWSQMEFSPPWTTTLCSQASPACLISSAGSVLQNYSPQQCFWNTETPWLPGNHFLWILSCPHDLDVNITTSYNNGPAALID